SRSLHPGADPNGGILTLYWTCFFFISNVLVVCHSLLCFKARQSRTPDFASLKSGASTELEVGCKVCVDRSGVGKYELSCSLLALFIYYSIRIFNFFFPQMI
ncbi:MAG: hypothetical protein ACNYWM_06365, partial [Methanosarcinales archaeon]